MDTFISQNHLDALREKSQKSCLDQWILSFNHRQKKGHKFLNLRVDCHGNLILLERCLEYLRI